MKKKVFIYVGHSNWGKSMALKFITNNNSRIKTTTISNKVVRVRKMSNDDDGQGLLDWVTDIPIIRYTNFIIAFCPKLPIDDSNMTKEQQIAIDILIELQKTNDLFFFIQEEKYNNTNMKITQNEINWLKNYGVIRILSGQNDYIKRANEFLDFIKIHI